MAGKDPPCEHAQHEVQKDPEGPKDSGGPTHEAIACPTGDPLAEPLKHACHECISELTMRRFVMFSHRGLGHALGNERCRTCSCSVRVCVSTSDLRCNTYVPHAIAYMLTDVCTVRCNFGILAS